MDVRGAGAGPPAAAAAASSSAASIEADIVETNKLINLLDPPKDLMVGNHLTESDHGTTIKKMLIDLFSPGGTFPEKVKGVGDTKPDLKKSIDKAYGPWLQEKTNSITILRLKHSSGHDTRPTGLYVAQDAGPVDVVANPTFLITPGSILDPAGKTKKGNVVNLVQEFATLKREPYLQQLSMATVINGDITMTVSDKYYNIVIPTNIDDKPIECSFEIDTFVPKAGSGLNYFMGNETKNTFIRNHIGETKECKKYILVKELGDTLQVQWLNYVFDASKDYTNQNTVITTCDTVVWYRSIVNKIPVIFTNPKGQTTYYSARIAGEAQKAAITASFINTIRTEVISNNLSVIQTLIDVKDKPRGASNKWINGNGWADPSYINAKTYLETVVKKLENINKDIDMYFSILANIDAAKELAAKSHFLNPFTYYKSEDYYKTNNKVIYLLQNGTFTFKAKQFEPSKFANPPSNSKLFQIGGARRSFDRIKKDVAAFRNEKDESQRIAKLNDLLEVAIKDSIHDSVHTPLKAASDKAKAERNTIAPVGKPADFINDLWITNTSRPEGRPGSFIGLDTVDYFVYCYVRDNHPEVFTYAASVKKAMNANLKREYNLVDFDLGERYPVEYFIGDQTGRMQVTVEPNDATKKAESLKATIQALQLAKFLVDSFQVLVTQNLANFLAFLTNNGVIKDIQFVVNVGDVLEEQKGGGEKESLFSLASEAMDIYEMYYSFALEAAYLDKEFPYDRFYKAIGSEPRVSPLVKKSTKLTGLVPSKKKTGLVSPKRKTLRRTRMGTRKKIPIQPIRVGGKRFKKTVKKRNS